MNYIPYTANEGDRWDTIAWRFYGNALLIAGLIAANPAIPVYPVLPAGVVVYVPILTPPALTVAARPPWLAAAEKAGQIR